MTKDFQYKAVVTVYKSGNSRVITIPPQFPIEVGEEYTLTSKDKRFILEKVKTMRKNYALRKLKTLIGKLPGSTKDMSVEELEKFLEGAYA